LFRVFAACVFSILAAGSAAAADSKDPAVKGREPPATPANKIKILAKGFKVELLYSVPKAQQGSWVSLCHDPQGRLIASDQYGPLYRITPPPLGGKPEDTKVEKLDLPIGEAQGLVWAFDSLYVVVNKGAKYESGLYRVRSSKGDGKLDEVKLLRKINGGSEHGPHAVLLAPGGKSLYVVVGDGTKMMEPLASSRVPQHFGEDHLLPRMPDGRGFMRDVLGPGGCIYRVDPEGKSWELISTGYRNTYDSAFNRHGDLFTFDADMEWDINTPWYRPTRVCLAVSGSEFGWRNGAGKWPPHYPDSWPAVLDIGPGSPTGMTFGYGAKFPAKYQEALFMCDWSYGKLYAVHLTPDGSSYKATAEEFLNGTPLPLTDIVINPKDGAMYFAIGGRKTKSGLYRVTYTGKDSTAPAPEDDRGIEARALRRKLEAFHGTKDSQAVETAWPYLNHPDRYIRSAARVAVEHQDPTTWQARALDEKEPARAIQALLALVRVTSTDPFHRKKDTPKVDEGLKAKLFQALQQIDWKALTDAQRLDLLRVYAIYFVRMGPPDEAVRKQTIATFDSYFPARNRLLNADLCQLLVYLQAPGVAGKALKLLAEAPTQEEQMEYAKSLRMLKSGWTPEQRKEYFSWFLKAAHFKGGNSFTGFMDNIKSDAVALLSAEEKKSLKPILEAKVDTSSPRPVQQRPFVKKWTVAELTPMVEKGLSKRDFDRGRSLFGAANCFACHRSANEGGALGPDLTGASGRFSVRDLLESIVEPSKEVSDQYIASIVITIDGKTVTGRIVNLHDNNITIMPNMLDPNHLINVDRRKVDTIENSRVSMMPEALLDTFKEDEILDLMAYLLSRGDRENKMFK